MGDIQVEKGPAGGKEDHTADGTVDLKGNPVLRSNTGISLLTLTVSLPSLNPPSSGRGIKEVECDKKASSLTKGIFYGALYIVVADNVGWTLGYAFPTLGLAVSLVVFQIGTPFYRHKSPAESPFIRMAQVLVAAVRNREVPVPDDPKQLHELSLDEYTRSGKFRIGYTSLYAFLDKAAVKSGSSSPWMLCSVTQVEDTKQMIKLLPVWAATFIPSTILAQVHTLFVQQGTVVDRSMGPHFKIPPATFSMLISLAIYDCYFVPVVRHYIQKPRGIILLQRMGIGIVLHVIIMIAACFAERKRLSVAREHNILFVLMGVADNFVEVAKLEFFYDQAPEGMKSLGTSYFTGSLGIGNFLSSFILTKVSNVTKNHGLKGWILDNLNISRLDYYYAFLAILSFLNFLLYLAAARFFVYNVDVDSRRDLQEQKEASLVKAHHQDN
ncbi:unnamed protein product [Dovyalis caffra]|uniref:Uncharacterized protein n=1 Tax=Dovyalis caffra TaxID=77055 RepID=A0AAV1SG16_9ROSI|nr:unnamed protein product [Dovyalis caffra]